MTSKSYTLYNDVSRNDQNKIVEVTLVTGLWDLGRSELEGYWSRKYNDYLTQFIKLLDIDNNMIIFGDSNLESIVWEKRRPNNTQFILRNLDWFKKNDYYDKIQKIRQNPIWQNQVEWLAGSPQARLDMYNPIVMSKMFLLNDARIYDKFNSDYMFWIDAGITFTVSMEYFLSKNILKKLPKYISKFLFIIFPYETISEIHGFTYNKICEYASCDVKYVARGGFFGGPKQSIQSINSIYYHMLINTLENYCMGTEESIFTIILYKYHDMVCSSQITNNGLIYKFFDDLKNDTIKIKN